MPHIAVTMIPGRTPEQKQALAEKIQELFVRELNLDKKFVSVSVEDIPAENWQDSMKQFKSDIMFVKPGV